MFKSFEKHKWYLEVIIFCLSDKHRPVYYRWHLNEILTLIDKE